MSRFTDWLKEQKARVEGTLLPKAAAAAERAVAPPSEPSQKLLGTSAVGMSDLDADFVLGAGGYAAPAMAAAAPVSPAIAERSARAAQNTLDAAEGGRSFASIHAAHRPADAPKPKPYDRRLHSDGTYVPEEAKGQGR